MHKPRQEDSQSSCFFIFVRLNFKFYKSLSLQDLIDVIARLDRCHLPDLIDVIAGLDPAISFYKFRHNRDYRVKPDNDTHRAR